MLLASAAASVIPAPTDTFIRALEYDTYLVICMTDEYQGNEGLCGVIPFSDMAQCDITDPTQPLCE